MAEGEMMSEADMTNAGAEAVDSSNDVADAITDTTEAEANGESIKASEATNKADEAQTETLDKMGKGIGTENPITQATVDDASQDTPKTSDGAKVKSYWERFKSWISNLFSSEQTANGEDGKDPNSSEKTKASFFDKYGKYALAIALLAGLGALALNQLGDSLSGCYQVFTNSSTYSTPTRVGCSQSQCSCQGVNNSGCANPTCSEGKKEGVNYYWQKVSALQALAMLPGIVAGGVLGPAKGFLGSISKYLLYGGILLVVLIVLYIIYNFYSNRKDEVKASFKFRYY